MIENKDIVKCEITLENKSDKSKSTFSIDITFDKIYRSWMRKLISFMKKAEREQTRYLLEPATRSFLEQPEYSFLGTSSTCCKSTLLHFNER